MASELSDPPNEAGVEPDLGRARGPLATEQAPEPHVETDLGDRVDAADSDSVTDEEIAAARAARAQRLAASRPGPSTARRRLGWVAVLGGAVLVALLVRTYVLEQFWIPSPSMAQTLEPNDRVLVNKLAYDLHDVHRGDVVVFERPDNQAGTIKDLIKRVVGLPGERVSILDGTVRIDGRPLEEPYVGDLQTAPNVGCGLGDTTGIDTSAGLLIPEGKVLVLGDNRIDSQDGRCFGPIDEDRIVGRAFAIIWPLSKMGGL